MKKCYDTWVAEEKPELIAEELDDIFQSAEDKEGITPSTPTPNTANTLQNDVSQGMLQSSRKSMQCYVWSTQ